MGSTPTATASGKRQHGIVVWMRKGKPQLAGSGRCRGVSPRAMATPPCRRSLQMALSTRSKR
eukprot:13380989-Alexandrium_andersonii.AAC.1